MHTPSSTAHPTRPTRPTHNDTDGTGLTAYLPGAVWVGGHPCHPVPCVMICHTLALVDVASR